MTHTDDDDVPTREKSLGVLTDRAVSMPWIKPTALIGGHREFHNGDNLTIREDIDDAAELLGRVLTARNIATPWSRADLIVDDGGPWWTDALNKFLDLSDEDRQWALDRLPGAADKAGRVLTSAARTERWRWIWSQVPLHLPGAVSKPRIVRPDLIVGTSPKDIIVIDLKVTSGKPADKKTPVVATAMSRSTEYLTKLGYTVRARKLLVITVPKCADGTYGRCWINV